MSTEILELNKDLIKFNITDSKIEEMSKEFMPLRINGIGDKAGLDKVYKARIIVKNKRIEVEKKRKELVEDAVKFQKAVNGEATRIKNLLEPIEEHLQNEEEKIEIEKQRIADEIKKREEEKIQNRINQLSAYGFAIDINIVKALSDDDFATQLQSAKEQHEAELAAKAEQERLAKEEAERLRLEREEFEKQRQEQARKEEAFRLEQERIKKEAEERDAAVKAEAERLAKVQSEREEKIRQQEEALKEQLRQAEEQKLREQREREHAAELLKAKEEAAEKARLQAIEDARLAEKKKIEDARLAKIEQERQEALRPDKEKLDQLAKDLLAYQLPTLTQDESKKIVAGVKQLLGKVSAYITENSTKL